MKAYSDEHMVAVVRLLALRLWRPPLVADWRAAGCRPSFDTAYNQFGRWHRFLDAAGVGQPYYTPAWGKSPGHRVYWTRERVIEGMRRARAELGYFPSQPRDYLTLKKGRMDWPREDLIRKLGGGGRSAWRRAMAIAGLGADIEGWSNGQWTEEDDEFLLTHAGEMTLKKIGWHLGRSWAACKRRLYDLGTRARDARGCYTAMVLAQELNVPVSRIYAALHSRRLKGVRPKGRPYWQIDPESVEENREWLTRPKKSHTSTPPVTVDWYRQHGLRRDGAGHIIGRRAVAAGAAR